MAGQPAVTDVIRTSDRLFLDFARVDLGHPEMPDLSLVLRETLHGHCHEDSPALVCRTYSHPMYLRADGSHLSVRHINTKDDSINHGESDEHKACKDRIFAMAQTRGLEAVCESGRSATGRSTSDRRNDVWVRGEKSIGYEAAYTDTAAAVTRKLHRGARDGITVYFGGPREALAARNFVDRAPHGTYNHIPALEIARGRPMPVISGLRRLRRWRCAGDPHLCPHFGKPTTCTRTWHSDYLDPEGGIDQDDVVYYLATGLWTPVALPAPTKSKTSWQIVPTASIQDYLADGGALETEIPTEGKRRSAKRTTSSMANPECVYGERIKPEPMTPAVIPVLRCGWSDCVQHTGLRLYAAGFRCPSHTPAALAGSPEPDELIIIGRANVTRRTQELRAGESEFPASSEGQGTAAHRPA